MKLLVEAGANVNFQKYQTGLTALHWAAYNNDKPVVSYLMRNGAELRYSFTEETPLDVAGYCENDEVSIIHLLFKLTGISIHCIP